MLAKEAAGGGIPRIQQLGSQKRPCLEGRIGEQCMKRILIVLLMTPEPWFCGA